MPEVYDPRSTDGITFPSRRSRKKRKILRNAVVVGRAKTTSSASQKRASRRSLPIKKPKKAHSIDDAFEFGRSSGYSNNADHDLSRGGALREKDNRTQGTKRNERISSPSNDGKAPKISIDKVQVVTEQKDTSEVMTPTMVSGTLQERVTNDNSSSSLSRYAIAIDTRYLNMQAGKEDQAAFQTDVTNFLRTTFRQRGFSASVVAWTESSRSNSEAKSSSALKDIALGQRNENDTNIRIHSKQMEDGSSYEMLRKMNGSPIQACPTKSEELTNDKMLSRLPNGLKAKSTWKVFADLVDASVDHDSTSFTVPLKVVLFTSATTMLLDTNATNHIHGMDAFWDKLQRLKQKVQSVDIVVVKGETVIVRYDEGSHETTHENTVFHNGCDNDHDDNGPPGESNQINKEQVIVNGNEGGRQNSNTEGRCSELKNSLREQENLVEKIQQHIVTKVDKCFNTTCSRLQIDSEFQETFSTIRASVSVLDNVVDFYSLCEKWSRESLQAAMISDFGQIVPTISFQLPETSAFDACEVSFATFYKNMPFRVDSFKARQLYADLILLSKTNLHVIQLVPFSSIDASLIYGIAIGLRVLQEDEKGDRESLFLFQSLCNQLAKRDCALCIRSSPEVDFDEENCRKRLEKDTGNDGLFHSAKESQYFLLMPEFVVSKGDCAAPNTGVLRRIVSANHFLEQTSSSNVLNQYNPYNAKLEEELKLETIPFSKYLEESLDSLKCSSLNPYRLQDTNKKI